MRVGKIVDVSPSAPTRWPPNPYYPPPGHYPAPITSWPATPMQQAPTAADKKLDRIIELLEALVAKS